MCHHFLSFNPIFLILLHSSARPAQREIEEGMHATLGFLRNSHVPIQLLPNHDSFSTSIFKPTPIIAHSLEIRVCTNRTCRRQGSFQTLETLSGLAPPGVAVKSCGCLGKCGGGPNIAVLPDGFIVGHCGTAARAAEVMMSLSVGGCDPIGVSKSLEALALRKRAVGELEEGNFSQAELLLSQALELEPCGGIHMIFKERSVVRLALGNHSGALEDTNEALKLAPQYVEAYICQGDAYLAMDHFDAAETSYLRALEADPSIRRSKSFKERLAKLERNPVL